MKTINVGIIGLGTVGTGTARIILDNADVIEAKTGIHLNLKRIADKDLDRDRGLKLPDGVMTDDASVVLNDPDIDIVVELVGGTTIAKDFTVSALKSGKHVVTANKALLSTFGKEILTLARARGLQVGFEASVGGGIPCLKALREGLSANRIESIYGIINGTANYILTKMTDEGGDFEDVLKVASEKGYAEADPSYDVDGIDTAHKLALLIDISYGTFVSLEDIYIEGIRKITPVDIEFAKEFGYRIKLLAISKESDGKIEARVHPTMVPVSHQLAKVDGVYNAVFINGDAVGSTMFYGHGAGMMATASAVVADIVDIARDINCGSTGRVTPLGYVDEAIKDVEIKDINDLETDYYLRFTAVDKPGVLSTVAGVLGKYNISISSVIQKVRNEGDPVPLVIVTHTAREKEMKEAIRIIEELDVITDETIIIRIEENLGESE